MYLEKIETPNIYGLGDTHDLTTIGILADKYDLSNCVLIHLGDAGEGFGRNPVERDSPILFHRVNPILEERNIKLLIVRGNHSNPSYFDRLHFFNKELSNIEFVEDYSYKTLNDKTFLFVGGATSIDRQVRTTGLDYWKDEVFKLPTDLTIIKPADVLITHSAPSECPPYGFANILGWFKNDPKLKDMLIKERSDISTLVKLSGVSQVYMGHFHQTVSERIDHIFYRILDINEIVSISNYLK
jgi:predicted phosphodiesterase